MSLRPQANIGRRASDRQNITEANHTRSYNKKNGWNGLCLRVLLVFDSSDPFTKKAIEKRTRWPEGGELNNSLDYLVEHDCLEYIPEEKSTVGKDAYKITLKGVKVRLRFWSNDPIQNLIRDSLRVKEPNAEESDACQFMNNTSFNYNNF